jgi:hypothetical protein
MVKWLLKVAVMVEDLKWWWIGMVKQRCCLVNCRLVMDWIELLPAFSLREEKVKRLVEHGLEELGGQIDEGTHGFSCS